MNHPLQQKNPVRRRSLWTLLLILPYIGLLFPQMYNRAGPGLWGFPFFYWYQFAWVILSSLITGLVYFKTRPPESTS
jgi:hypothetical protein